MSFSRELGDSLAPLHSTWPASTSAHPEGRIPAVMSQLPAAPTRPASAPPAHPSFQDNIAPRKPPCQCCLLATAGPQHIRVL
ncbi:MAG: hypothetical protein WDW38_010317 [Sanguina aurantia]